jgi:hypothetical protein
MDWTPLEFRTAIKMLIKKAPEIGSCTSWAHYSDLLFLLDGAMFPSKGIASTHYSSLF